LPSGALHEIVDGAEDLQRRRTHLLDRTHGNARDVAVLHVTKLRQRVGDFNERLVGVPRAVERDGIGERRAQGHRHGRQNATRRGQEMRREEQVHVGVQHRCGRAHFVQVAMCVAYAVRTKVLRDLPVEQIEACGEPRSSDTARGTDVDGGPRGNEIGFEQRQEREQRGGGIAAGVRHQLRPTHGVALPFRESVRNAIAVAIANTMIGGEIHYACARGARARDPLGARAMRQRRKDELRARERRIIGGDEGDGGRARNLEGLTTLRVRRGKGERKLRVPRDQRTQLPPCIP
jgi:hypothetical protein